MTTVDLKPKTFLILYPSLENPTTGIAILLGEPHNLSGNNNNESFHSNADFEDLDHMPKLRNTYNCPLPGKGIGPFPTHHSTRQRSSRSAHPVHNSNLDLRRVGSQMNRPQSHSPARGRCLPSATRR